MAGHKVIAIDVDLRRPSFSRMKIKGHDMGLVDYLDEEATLSDIIQVDGTSGAHIIFSGKQTQNPPDIRSRCFLAGFGLAGHLEMSSTIRSPRL